MSEDKYKGYKQSIYLLRELDFDPAFKLPDQVYECVKSGIIDIRKARKSIDASNKVHLVMKCHFFLMINGAPFPLPIHIWLREKDYPVSMYPVIVVDLTQDNFMYNPDCNIILANGIVRTHMIEHWNQNYTLLQVLQDIQSQFMKVFPICQTQSSSNEVLNSILSLKSQVNTIPLKDLTIGNILGSGNFADVHKGRYMDHDVAIKIYKKTPEGKDLTGFQREVIIQSKLNHKNIIKLYGLSHKDGHPVIVMELGGIDLRNMILSRNFSMTFEQKIQVALQIASAIEYMHDRNLIHRDIKCENIIFANGEYKLTDFGLAREEDPNTRMTVCGTPVAMAPELFGKGKYNEKVDIYSFGIVLYQLFTEREPYAEEIKRFDSQKILYNIVNHNLRPTIPRDMVNSPIYKLITQCWDNSPNIRPNIKSVIAILRTLSQK